MSDPENTSAIIQALPKQLGFPSPKQLAIPVAGTAALVWIGKKALSIVRAQRKPSAIAEFVKPAAELMPKPKATRKTTRRVIIERTTISINIHEDDDR